MFLMVAQLCAASSGRGGDKYLRVVDKNTGLPIIAAIVEVKRAGNIVDSLLTDSLGITRVPDYESAIACFVSKYDCYDDWKYIYESVPRGMEDADTIRVLLQRSVGGYYKPDAIYFDEGKVFIRPDAQKELDKLLLGLKASECLNIEISAYADKREQNNVATEISKGRYKAVFEWLAARGIDAKRLSGKWYGISKPLNLGKTAEERQVNRRVEFKVIRVKEK